METGKITEVDSQFYGVAQQQQRANEDRHSIKQLGNFKYYAVFDGHGGGGIAIEGQHIVNHAVNSLHIMLARELAAVDTNIQENVVSAITKAFVLFDRNSYIRNALYGCTCVMLLVGDDYIYQAHVGDSRSLIFDNFGILYCSSDDHLPLLPDENDRIVAAGGAVEGGRVNGSLAVSRAFGDYPLKYNSGVQYDAVNGCVSAVPSIKIIARGEQPLYFILTSDAPYEYYFDDSSLVAMACRYIIQQRYPYGEIARRMVEEIKPHTSDDITIVIGRC